jgi:hypothetical protein
MPKARPDKEPVLKPEPEKPTARSAAQPAVKQKIQSIRERHRRK